jgi:RHS repeat-associated protein
MRTKAIVLALLCACGTDHGRAGDAGPDDAGVPAPDAGVNEGPHACSGPLDRSAPTDFYDAARCLFAGANAPQIGVDPTVFERERIAIVHGRVLDTDGSGLGGATVAIADHPEYGHTQTRHDGTYDLAVEGGGQLVVQMTLAGRIAAQRHVQTRWRRFEVASDVTLLPFASPVAVAIAPSGALVEGASGQDASGSRSSVLFFQPGTTATIIVGGASQTLTSFHLHSTEFTVGDRGPTAMPGDLPANSGYTYAVDFSVDEAVAAGAEHVTFDPPVVHYVDDFLHFPTGTVVPNGYFDAKSDTWQAGDSGRVVQIVAISGGVAQLDADGDGIADADASLAALGITTEERTALGGRFAAGKQLWRVPIPHFSPWDHNWPFGPPADATGPDDAGSSDRSLNDCKTTSGGSIIGCDDQTLGEELHVPGTNLTLHYQSERADGRLDANRIDIKLAGASVPASLKRIDAEVEVLGEVTTRSFSAAPNATWSFDWDGLDAYGRAWQGRQLAHVKVGFVYDGSYQQTNRFGYNGDGTITGDRTRQEVTIWKSWDTHVGKFTAGPLGLGGWTLGVQNILDAPGGQLALGNGRTRVAERIGGVITTVAGTEWQGSTGDGGPASAAEISSPHGIAIAPDGSVFFSEDDSAVIRRIAPDGTISVYAGTGTAGFAGDGGPALAAQFDRPLGLALAPDGTLYIADGNNSRVRAISPQGIISTFAGGGTSSTTNGDGGPATAAYIAGPHAVALGPDGSLYIADDSLGQVRRVTPDGTITTIATGLSEPLGLCVGPSQEVYVTEWTGGQVDKIAPDGTRTVVISGLSYPHTVDTGPDGSLYVTEEGYQRVLRRTADGLVYPIAGGGSSWSDNVAPLTAAFAVPRVVYVHKDGTLWIADWSDQRIRRVRPSLPGFLRGETAVASQDGGELYIFDDHGRHLRTIDARTGAVTLAFGYDAAGRLATVTDVDGNALTIARDASGAPMAIVSPSGVTTMLAVDANGNLASMTDAAGRTTAMTYGAGGMLATLVEPRGDVHRFTYDSEGRLVRDESPTGLAKTLAAGSDGAITTTLAGGATTVVASSSVDSTTTRSYRDPGGLLSRHLSSPTGTTVTTPTATATATYAADPRFGMTTPYPSSLAIAQGTHQMSISHTRSAVMTDMSNPLTLQTLTDATTVNGHTSQTTWTAATRTLQTISAEGRTVTSTYDARGHLVQAQLGSLAPVTYTYDSHGARIATTRDGRTIAATLDAHGRLAALTDPLGQTSAVTRDAAGLVTGEALADGSTLALAYDANGSPLSVATPGHTTDTLAFGAGNLPVSFSGMGVAASKTYDADGRVTSFVRPDGSAVAIGYDAAGRVGSVGYPGDARTVNYDAATGHVAAMSSTSEQLAYSYEGDLLTGVAWSGALGASYSREFDDDFTVAADTAGSTRITYAHDGDGLLTSAGSLAISRTGEGLVATTSLAGVSDGWTYDTFGDAATYTVNTPVGAAYALSITRDALGRVAQRTETVGSVTHTDAFSYDARGRLVAQTRDGASAGSWAWDGDGNRTTGATYDAHGRLVALGAAGFSYDDNGSLISRTSGGETWSYTYDAAGALHEVALPSGTIVDYVLDPTGRRIGKQRDGVLVQQLVYSDGLHAVAELDATGQLVSRFVYASKRDVPDYMIKGGATYRLVSDLTGSVRLVVDASTGAIAQQIDYDAFGNVTADSNPGFQPFGFGSGLYDADTGLVHFGAREYDPAAGRFISMDPSGLAGGTNVYLYANGDPVNYVDPDGHFAQVIAAALGAAAIGGGVELALELWRGDCINWRHIGQAAAANVVVDAALTGMPWLAPEVLPLLEDLAGPWGKMTTKELVNSFENGINQARIVAEDTLVYRAEGWSYGSFYGLTEPTSAVDAEALYNVAKYGNDLGQSATYLVPQGTLVYEGPVAGGAGTQWLIPPGGNVSLVSSVPLPVE